MSRLTDKGRGINFDDDDEEDQSRAPTAPPPRPALKPDRPRTAIGAISASLAMGRGIEEENRQLRDKLKQFEDATVIEWLDPKSIQASRYANRHELSFDAEAFQSLKQEISSAGRNVQPIKVRRLPGKAEDLAAGAALYEIVFGHRRHRACLELGIPVAAIVAEMSDAELFMEMDRENRERQNLSPWEQGVMYKRALDDGLFPSLRRLAADLGVQQGNVSTAIQLASLPTEIVGAFPSPLTLQYRWAKELMQALATDRAETLKRARELSVMEPRPAAKEVLARLTERSSESEEQGGEGGDLQSASGEVVGRWSRDAKGNLSLQIRHGALPASKQRKLLDAVKKVLA